MFSDSRRYGNIVPITDGQDEGPTADIVAEMDYPAPASRVQAVIDHQRGSRRRIST
ncbi:hypothetical protein ACFVMC_13670 [Nocardia sp. NPDC127579]|uniref:hypothetical protein n=1 Tax=Nocardia sp. NPDC127579 TaxID=3345402 RepID=UPI0036323B01